MQYNSESDIQEAYGWEFISEQQYEHYLESVSYTHLDVYKRQEKGVNLTNEIRTYHRGNGTAD